MPVFSLIVPSLNRTREVDRLFDSRINQTRQDFEVILVDQNQDRRLDDLVKMYSEKFPLRHIRVRQMSAASARNTANRVANGDIMVWPDDDSWLPTDFLDNLYTCFDSFKNASGLIGILVDAAGHPHTRWSLSRGRQAAMLDVFTRGAEPAIFFRRAAMEELGGFDEYLGTGAGTPWGAGEGSDLCVRALRSGLRVRLEPTLCVYHDLPFIDPGSETQLEKVKGYAQGMGAVLRKNRLPLSFVLVYFFTYFRALTWSLFRGDWSYARFHWTRLKAVIYGWRAYQANQGD